MQSLREPTPELRDHPPETKSQATAAATARKPTPAASFRAPPPPRFRSQSEPTKLRGTISNQGSSSVDAADTALGRYMKQVTSAIEKEWHRKRRRYADFVTYGTIQLEFYLNKSGRVESLSIRNRNGANAVMQDFTLSAVLDAALPPMPADLPEIVDHDRLQITYDIIVY
jgi:outer membrane biosynthesis protein TonB